MAHHLQGPKYQEDRAEPSLTVEVSTKGTLDDTLAEILEDVATFRHQGMQLAYLQTEVDAHDIHNFLRELEDDLRGKFNLVQLIISQHRWVAAMQPYAFRMDSLRTIYERLRVMAEAAERRRSRRYGLGGWTTTRCCNIYASQQFSPLRHDDSNYDQYLQVCDELASYPSGSSVDDLYRRLHRYGDIERLTRQLCQTRALVARTSSSDADQKRSKSRYNYLNRISGLLQTEWEQAEERRPSSFQHVAQEIDACINLIQGLPPAERSSTGISVPVLLPDRRPYDRLQPMSIEYTDGNAVPRAEDRGVACARVKERDRRWSWTRKRSRLPGGGMVL